MNYNCPNDANLIALLNFREEYGLDAARQIEDQIIDDICTGRHNPFTLVAKSDGLWWDKRPEGRFICGCECHIDYRADPILGD